MKIAIITAVYYPQVNGVAVFSHNLALGLKRLGEDVLVICPSLNGKGEKKNEDGIETVRIRSHQIKMYPDQVHKVPEKQRLWYKHGLPVAIKPEKEVFRALESFRPDVVHIQVADPIGAAAAKWARKNRIPIVTTEHNEPEVLTEPLKLPKLIKRPANTFLTKYFLGWHGKSDFVTMPTKKAIMNLLKNGEISAPVAAVSNGVDLSCFRPGQVKDDFLKKYGLKKNSLKVLYVGRVDPEKNIEGVIRAFDLMLKEARPKLPVEMLIVGDGVDKVRLTKLVKRMGREGEIKFLGKVVAPDLYEFYRLGDVFVTASEIETQGIVLIEAAASGLPLVAVDKGAVAEVCRDGVNGFLCVPGNEKAIAEAMGKILNDEELRKKFSEESIKIAKEHDFERTLEQFMNIYKKIAEK